MNDKWREEVKAMADEELQSYSINALTVPGYRTIVKDEIERRRIIVEANLSPDEKIAKLEARVFELEQRVSSLANRTPLL